MPDNIGKNSSTSKTTKRVTTNRSFTRSTPHGTSKKTAKTNNNSAVKTVATTAVTSAAAVSAIKAVKKIGGKSFAIILVCFILALCIGVGVCFFLGKNDKFELLGSEQIVLEINEKYADEGVEIREFGINLSKNAILDTDLKKDDDGNYYAESAGDYYISYSIKSLKFGLVYPIQKIRLISVVGASEGGE